MRFLEFDLEYPKVLQELDNDFPLAPDKIEMQSEHQLKTAYLYNIAIGNVKTLVAKFFDNKKYVIHYENLQIYLRLGLKLKKNILCVRI